ncbi:UNKNOWN [Stylonychia lemnae]|uniref:Uncharacterized protein n=1 Tax=Stylonychia lemnae TaxID=5949 RepID=A0A078A8Z0_STYLE|nr:UNKNOWN [Stylonychia lemnae]|eukprot:CDW78740.1 UNKNOWN [Stylonychia lemnae]
MNSETQYNYKNKHYHFHKDQRQDYGGNSQEYYGGYNQSSQPYKASQNYRQIKELMLIGEEDSVMDINSIKIIIIRKIMAIMRTMRAKVTGLANEWQETGYKQRRNSGYNNKIGHEQKTFKDKPFNEKHFKQNSLIQIQIEYRHQHHHYGGNYHADNKSRQLNEPGLDDNHDQATERQRTQDSKEDRKIFSYSKQEQLNIDSHNVDERQDKDYQQHISDSHTQESQNQSLQDLPSKHDDIDSCSNNERHDSECTLSVVAETDFDIQQQEAQDDEYTSTQQLIQFCQEKERNISGNRVVTIKNAPTDHLKQGSSSYILDYNDEQTTTGGDSSLMSAEETASPQLRKPKIIDLQGQGVILCEISINTPGGQLEIKLREYDYPFLQTIVELIYKLGEFKIIEMKEGLFIYLEDMMSRASFQRLQDQIKPFYPQNSRQNVLLQQETTSTPENQNLQ